MFPTEYSLRESKKPINSYAFNPERGEKHEIFSTVGRFLLGFWTVAKIDPPSPFVITSLLPTNAGRKTSVVSHGQRGGRAAHENNFNCSPSGVPSGINLKLWHV